MQEQGIAKIYRQDDAWCVVLLVNGGVGMRLLPPHVSDTAAFVTLANEYPRYRLVPADAFDRECRVRQAIIQQFRYPTPAMGATKKE